MIAAIIPVSSYACTVFTLNDNGGRYIARSFDWDYGDGVVLVNPRGASKTSLLFEEGIASASWTSQYGSVTINQAADEFPMSGMNEAGLTIDVLILSKSKFPRQFTKPVMNEVQVIQYLLDTAATVDEAKAQVEKIQIKPFAERVHYMVCDVKSECAAFEYLNGEMVVSKYAAYSKQILANDLYSETLDPRKMTTRPKAAYDYLMQTPLDGRDPIAYMMTGLQKVKLPSSRWQMVYNVTGRQISFRDVNANKNLKMIDLNKVDFSCSKVKGYIDISNAFEGEISNKLANFTQARNEVLLSQVLPDPQLIPYVTAYYNQLNCASTRLH